MAIENFTAASIDAVFVQIFWILVVVRNIQPISVADFYTIKEHSATFDEYIFVPYRWSILNHEFFCWRSVFQF